MRNGDISFWYADCGLPPPRPPLQGDTHADVCIIGAGYTGLWAAWYLKQQAPGLAIVMVEREFAGFGASGRNGGWLTGGFAWNHRRYLEVSDRSAVQAMIAAVAGTVAEVIAVAEACGIDADIHRTDELLVATNPAQMARLVAFQAARESWDVAADRSHLIGAAALQARLAVHRAEGAMVIAGVARLQPAKLVKGLAAAVAALGVQIAEGTTVLHYGPGLVETDRGRVRAPVILRATEGFTAGLPGHGRDWLAMNSAQIVTDPLPDALWDQIGWQGRELFGDYAHSYCYAQRTREGRIAMGGRGVPYRYGSRTDHRGQTQGETIRQLTAILHRHFPQLRAVPVAHAWCGTLAVPRDWCASVGFDAGTGLGYAGGYVGVGVSTSNLAGRTLADLALGQQTDRTALPWVNRKVRQWEGEPLRWLGVHAMYRLFNLADRAEARGGGQSRLAALANRVMGRH